MPLEAVLERRARAALLLAGATPLKLWPTVRGLPDRLVLFPGGKVWFVEFKTLTGRVSPAQTYVHGRLRDLGFKVSVIRTWEEFKIELDRLGLLSQNSDSYHPPRRKAK